MSIADSSEKSSRGCPRCGDPAAFLARYAALLEEWDEARRDEQEAAAHGDPSARYVANWRLVDREADLLRFREDLATLTAMSLRWLDELFPAAVGPLKAVRHETADLRRELAAARAELAELRRQGDELEAALAEAVTA